MGRRTYSNEHYFYDQLEKVTDVIAQKKRTWGDLREIAVQWCSKNYEYHKQEAKHWGVAPLYLLTTALLCVEHPLIVGEGRDWLYNPTEMTAKIVWAELTQANLPIPVNSTNSFHSPSEKIEAYV